MVIKIFQNIDKSGERSKTADGYDEMINMIKIYICETIITIIESYLSAVQTVMKGVV